MDPIIYLFEEDLITAESITWLIESLQIRITRFTDFKDVIENLDTSQHGCLILDTLMIDNIELKMLTKLKEIGATLPIIFVSSCDHIPSVVNVLKNGAFDFITKPVDDYRLLESINSALKEDIVHRKHVQDEKSTRLKISQLSPREMQVLQGIVDGLQNKAISALLKISLKTTEAHRAHLMKKMEVKSVPELVKLALSQNIKPKTS